MIDFIDFIKTFIVVYYFISGWFMIKFVESFSSEKLAGFTAWFIALTFWPLWCILLFFAFKNSLLENQDEQERESQNNP